MTAILAILALLADDVIVAAILLWLLPHLGVEVPVGVVVGVMVAGVGFSALAYRPVKHAMQREAHSGAEAMLGKTATAITDMAPRGQVKLRGEIWKAVSSEHVRSGEEVRVLQLSGLELIVRRVDSKGQTDAFPDRND